MSLCCDSTRPWNHFEEEKQTFVMGHAAAHAKLLDLQQRQYPRNGPCRPKMRSILFDSRKRADRRGDRLVSDVKPNHGVRRVFERTVRNAFFRLCSLMTPEARTGESSPNENAHLLFPVPSPRMSKFEAFQREQPRRISSLD